MARVLVICQDRLGDRMAGPAIRSLNLARELARRFDVTLLATQAPGAGFDPGLPLQVEERLTFRRMTQLASGADVVVSQPLRLHVQSALHRAPTPVIYDLYVPSLVETLASQGEEDGEPLAERERRYRRVRLEAAGAVRSGDAFICASEAQRGFWLGALGGAGRLGVASYGSDPRLRSLIDVVPFGCPADEPVADGPALRGVVPGIGKDDFLLLWTGGIWNWFDPVTVIRAVGNLHRRGVPVKLYFMGVQHPNEEIRMRRTADAFACAQAEGLVDTAVFFSSGWVPYEQRAAYLLEADAGVLAHFDNAETSLAFRTRLLDHFWAGLPSIVTRGGALSDLVGSRGLGTVVDFEDVAGWEHAIEQMAADQPARAAASKRARDVARELAWSLAVTPLVSLVEQLARGRRSRLGIAHMLPAYTRVQMQLQGPRVALAKAARSLTS